MTKKRKWELVMGDRDPVTFGGWLINHRTGDLWCIDGVNFEEPTRKQNVFYRDKNDKWVDYNRTVPNRIEVRRVNIEHSDPLNDSWVKWEDVLRHNGQFDNVDSMEPWERIVHVADYYGIANFDDYPVEFTEGQLRKLLRSYYKHRND